MKKISNLISLYNRYFRLSLISVTKIDDLDDETLGKANLPLLENLYFII